MSKRDECLSKARVWFLAAFRSENAEERAAFYSAGVAWCVEADKYPLRV